MADNVLEYIINVNGDAQSKVNQLTVSVQESNSKINQFTSSIQKIRDIGLAFDAVNSAVSKLSGMLNNMKDIYIAESVEITKLTQLMRNNVGATNEQILSVIELTEAQQKIGVIGKEVQLAGAQELSTYLSKTESIKALIPSLNDMLAQQYGLNASQEQAVSIAQMMGKVLDGQVGALSRYGYSFDEAQEKVLKFGTEEEKVAMLSQILQQYVGGVNEALADTPEGKMKQVSNNVMGLKANIGKLWVEIQASFLPVVEKVLTVAETVVSFIEKNRVIIGALTVVIGVLVAVIKGWIIVQGIINALMALNLIGLIITGIVALIAVIVYLCLKIKGWGTLWEAVVDFVTNITKAFVEGIKLYFTTVVNVIMIAIDKIKLGWYEFKEAIGIGDSKENQKMVEQISKDVEERKKAIADGANKVAEYSKAAFKSFDKVNMSIDQSVSLQSTMDKLKSGLGINGNTSVTNNDLSQDLSDASTTISAGGKSVKNFNITINDGLVNGVQNYFNDSRENPETASDFMWRLSNALQLIVNDVNYAAE